MITASPAELFGLPGPLAPEASIAALRYALLGMLVLVAVGLALGRARLGLGLATTLFVFVGVWWGLALGRPYGVLIDADTTRRAAEVSIAGQLGAPSGMVVLEPGVGTWGSWLSARGVPQAWILAGPIFLPSVLIPLVAVGVHLFWRRPERTLAAILWLLCGSGWLDAARGHALLTSAWATPASGWVIAGLVPLLLVAARMRQTNGIASVLALALLIGLGGGRASISLPELPWLLVFDPGVWVPLALVGSMARRDRSANALLGVGSAGLTASALGLAVDEVAAHALFRLGLILYGAVAIGSLAAGVGAALTRATRLEHAGLQSRCAGEAAMVFCLAAGGLLIWWNPFRADRVAELSRSPVSQSVGPVLGWIRDHTPRDAVVLASPDYAPAVAVRASRRVLRAPSLVATADDDRRVRTERMILRGRELPAWARQYAVTHVLAAPGDFRARGIETPVQLMEVSGLGLEYVDRHGIHVFSVASGARSSRGPHGVE